MCSSEPGYGVDVVEEVFFDFGGDAEYWDGEGRMMFVIRRLR